MLAGASPTPVGQALTDQLKTAASPAVAQALEIEAQAQWLGQASPATRLLIDHAAGAIQANHLRDAVSDLDAAVVLQPELGDLWRRRAELRLAGGDTAAAIADLARSLAREPAGFPALIDLAAAFEEQHDDRRALAAWRKLLELDPQHPGGRARESALQIKVSGAPL